MASGKKFLQVIEGAAQRAIIRATTLAARRPPAVDLASARRILFTRHDAIGDMIMTTGVFRRMREDRPDVEIDVLASRSNAPALLGLPYVGRVFMHKRGDVRGLLRLTPELRARRYDAVLDGRVIWPRVSTDTAFVLAASGAPRRIGIGNRVSDYVYSDRVFPRPDAHMIEYMAALTVPLGVRADAGDWRPELRTSPNERAAAEQEWTQAAGTGPRLLVNISSGLPVRRWPYDRYVPALREIRAAFPDLRILVMAPPHESAEAKAIASEVRGGVSQAPLRVAFALVESTDVLLTPDTSIAHAASAFQPLTVAMTAIPFADHFRPWKTPGKVLVGDGQTVSALPVEPVTAALREMLANGVSRRSAT